MLKDLSCESLRGYWCLPSIKITLGWGNQQRRVGRGGTNMPQDILYVLEVVTRPKIFNRTILSNIIHVT